MSIAHRCIRNPFVSNNDFSCFTARIEPPERVYEALTNAKHFSQLSTLIRNYGDVFLMVASGRGGEAFGTNLGQEGLKVATCERPLKR